MGEGPSAAEVVVSPSLSTDELDGASFKKFLPFLPKVVPDSVLTTKDRGVEDVLEIMVGIQEPFYLTLTFSFGSGLKIFINRLN